MKIEAENIHGFRVDENSPDNRCYYLAFGMIQAGADGRRLEVDLKTASNHEDDDHDDFFESIEVAKALGLDILVAVDGDFDGVHALDAEKKLAQRLEPYNGLVQPAFSRFFDGVFDEPEYIQLLAQCSDPDQFSSFMQACLGVFNEDAKRSLRDNSPSYRLQVPALLENLSKYMEVEIAQGDLPGTIAGFSRYRGADALGDLVAESGYVKAIVQPNGSSFTYNTAMQRQVSRLTRGLEGDMEKSRAIFDWITSNITYGKEKRKPGVQYRGALQVYKDREGVCGESAALQVTMERLAGNMAFLAEVGKDHACAAHITPSGEVVLVDAVSPQGFAVGYPKFKILSDNHSMAGYY